MPYFVYVLRNPAGKLYKGFTADLDKRILQHDSDDGFRSWTKGKGPWVLVYREVLETIEEAKRREKFLKSGAGRDFLKTKLDAYPPQADG